MKSENKEIRNGACMIILNQDNQILILRRNENDKYSPNLWCVPGGKIMKESFEKCIIREVKEETNLKITQLNFFKSYFRDEGNFYYQSVYFYGKAKGEIKLNYEHEEYKWISKEELNNYEFAFGQEKILQDFYQER